MGLSPYTQTLDSGARADSTTETYDIPTRGRVGLLLVTDVTVIGNGHSFVDGIAITLPLTITLNSNDTFSYNSQDYVIAAGVYTTLAALITAIGAALHSATAFSTLVTPSASPATAGAIRFTSVPSGVNTLVFAVGSTHDGLAAATGLTSTWTIAHTQAGGTDGAYSQTVTIQGKDEASGKFYTILAGAAMTGVATQVLQVHPGMVGSANLIAESLLPANIRVSITHTTDNSITRSIGLQLVS